MLASMESQDDDLLAFLSLDIHMPDVYDWGFGEQDVNTFESLHITGGGNSNVSRGNSPLADIDVGFGWCGVDRSVPSGLGVGGDGKKGLLEPGKGGSGMNSLYGKSQEIPHGQSYPSNWVSSEPDARCRVCLG
jgi:hypothetical protein